MNVDRSRTAVVLISGGVESSTLLRWEGRTRAVVALFVDYGQKAAAAERRAVDAQCRRAGCEPVALDLRRVGAVFRGSGAWRAHVPLPHRNLVLLALGLSYAERIGAGRVCLALNREDTHAYPAAGAAFLQRFRSTAATLAGDIAVAAPFVDLDKSAVAQLGRDLGVDFATTYSCLLGHRRHCGACPQCRHRRAALARAGIGEPAGFYRHEPSG